MRIVMVGSGYVGLVSGACLAQFGHDVICIDKDPAKIAALRYGTLPWTDHPSASTPDADTLLATVRMTVQAYTDRWQSADRISAPMPGSANAAQTIEEPVLDPVKTKPALE